MIIKCGLFAIVYPTKSKTTLKKITGTVETTIEKKMLDMVCCGKIKFPRKLKFSFGFCAMKSKILLKRLC